MGILSWRGWLKPPVCSRWVRCTGNNLLWCQMWRIFLADWALKMSAQWVLELLLTSIYHVSLISEWGCLSKLSCPCSTIERWLCGGQIIWLFHQRSLSQWVLYPEQMWKWLCVSPDPGFRTNTVSKWNMLACIPLEEEMSVFSMWKGTEYSVAKGANTSSQ